MSDNVEESQISLEIQMPLKSLPVLPMLSILPHFMAPLQIDDEHAEVVLNVSVAGSCVVELKQDSLAPSFFLARLVALFANETSMDNNPQLSQTMPNDSEPFRTVPQTSEVFGKVPYAAESLRTLPNTTERTDNHTLTVREVARMFEAAGVARTERSIINWCQPNRQGMARLNSCFDMNDRRWFLTPQSVASAIAEEQAKAARHTTEDSGNGALMRSETQPDVFPMSGASESDPLGDQALHQEVMDLKILNDGKDFLIEQIRRERGGLIDKLVQYSRQVGQLETELRQLGAPRKSSAAAQFADSPD